MDDLTGILAAYYVLIQMPTHFRMQVLDMKQGPMSISAYVQELVERGRKADFGPKEDGILRDLFIHGINDDKIHLELLNHVPATLEERYRRQEAWNAKTRHEEVRSRYARSRQGRRHRDTRYQEEERQ